MQKWFTILWYSIHSMLHARRSQMDVRARRRGKSSLGRASPPSHWLCWLSGLYFSNNKTERLPLPGSEHRGMGANRGNVIENASNQALDIQTRKAFKRTAVLVLVGKMCITIKHPSRLLLSERWQESRMRYCFRRCRPRELSSILKTMPRHHSS